MTTGVVAAAAQRHPGLRADAGFTLAYLGLIVLLPLAALVARTSGLSPAELWAIATTPRVVAAFRVSFGTALIAAVINVFFGLLVAWVLVRYRFPGHRLVDAHGRSAVRAAARRWRASRSPRSMRPNGWVGRLLEPLGIKVAFTPLGIIVALIFIGLPVRRAHRAAGAAGPRARASRRRPRRSAPAAGRPSGRVILPAILPALHHRRSRSPSRARRRRVRLGDLHRRQHADGLRRSSPLLIVSKLEQYDYAGRHRARR